MRDHTEYELLHRRSTVRSSVHSVENAKWVGRVAERGNTILEKGVDFQAGDPRIVNNVRDRLYKACELQGFKVSVTTMAGGDISVLRIPG